MKIRKICELLNYYYFIKCKKLAKTLRFFQKWTRGAPCKYKPGLIYFFLKSMDNEIIPFQLKSRLFDPKSRLFGFLRSPGSKLSLFLSLPLCRRSNFLTRGRGDVWAWSQMIRPRAWSSIIIQYSLGRHGSTDTLQ